MVTLILNPVAGERRGLKVLEPLQRLLSRLGGDVEIVKTIAPGDGAHLAAVALKRGCDHIVAVGGDGTVLEVLTSLAGQDATLGIVPLGTTNAIAHNLSLPMAWEEAVRIALTGTPRSVDVGLIGDRPFLGSATLTTEVTDGTPTAIGRLFKGRNDATGALLAFEIIIDDVLTLNASAHTVQIANLPGGSDGLLDLTIEGNGTPTFMKARRIEFRAPTDLALRLDGEVRRAAAPLILQVAPKRQDILVPTSNEEL